VVGLVEVHDHQRSGSLQLVTLEPSSASCSGQPHRPGAPPLELDVDADEYADFTKEYGPHREGLTLPTTPTRSSYFQVFIF